MPTPHPGFGLAAADLVLEIDPEGRVAAMFGAAPRGKANPLGRDWRSLIDPQDQPMVAALFAGLEDGVRAGPVAVGLAWGRHAAFSAIRLANGDGAIACAVTAADGRSAAGLRSRDSFESRAADILAGAGEPLELAFVELSGGDPRLVAEVLRAQAYRGEAATAAGPNRYALVRARRDPPAALAARVARALAACGVAGATTNAAAVPLTGVGFPKQVRQAVRFLLGLVQQHGIGTALPRDLTQALARSTRAALCKAGPLGAAIRHRRFTLAYQPVVALADGSLHHHEVLVRFGSEGSPFPTIRMAEQMDLIEPLDLAVLETSLAVLQREPGLVLAVNVSGRSLMGEAFVSRALSLLKDRPEVRGRLMFELTESAAVEDLVLADQRLQALRAAGCEVCLDDFGAGATSLAYLQHLTLDVVKIDGRYIRDLQYGGREATFVKHLVAMCRDLGVRTLAEMVETAEAEEIVRRAGVDYAQGWLYGRPAPAPQDPHWTAGKIRA